MAPDTAGTGERAWDAPGFNRLLLAYHNMCRTQLLIENSGVDATGAAERLRQQLAASIAEQYLAYLFGPPREPTPHTDLRRLLEQLRPDPERQQCSPRTGMRLLNPAYGYSDAQLIAHTFPRYE